MTREQGIRARLEAATPGPWIYDPAKCYRPGENGAQPLTESHEAVSPMGRNDSTIAITGRVNDPQAIADARLIACAPADLAYLLNKNDRLSRKLRKRIDMIRTLRRHRDALLEALARL